MAMGVSAAVCRLWHGVFEGNSADAVCKIPVFPNSVMATEYKTLLPDEKPITEEPERS